MFPERIDFQIYAKRYFKIIFRLEISLCKIVTERILLTKLAPALSNVIIFLQEINMFV